MNERNRWAGVLERVRRTFTAVGRRQSNRYNIEGIRLHERALRAGLTLETTLISESLAAKSSNRITELLAQLPSARGAIQTIPDEIMHDLLNGRGLGDIISLAKIPTPLPLAELLTAANDPLVLVACQIIDPGNVGAMIRSGHAHGITAFVTVGTSDPYHPKAVRTSMGSLFKTTVIRYQQFEPLLVDLKQLDMQTVGAAITDQATLLRETHFDQAGTAVFMGNEYAGLPTNLLCQLDKLVNISLPEGVDSLSVNAATAVILYEIRRQQADASTINS